MRFAERLAREILRTIGTGLDASLPAVEIEKQTIANTTALVEREMTGKLLVDRADLETAIVDRTAADGQAAICCWPGCGFYETRPDGMEWRHLTDHSRHCPLAEQA